MSIFSRLIGSQFSSGTPLGAGFKLNAEGGIEIVIPNDRKKYSVGEERLRVSLIGGRIGEDAAVERK